MTASPETLSDIVIANRILAYEEVVDAFGHISIRDPANPEQYLLSRARAPELIEADDIVTFAQTASTAWFGGTPFESLAVGMTLAVGGRDKKVALYDVATGGVRHELVPCRSVLTVAFAPDGLTLAAGSDGKKVALYDVATGVVRHELERDEQRAARLARRVGERQPELGGLELLVGNLAPEKLVSANPMCASGNHGLSIVSFWLLCRSLSPGGACTY